MLHWRRNLFIVWFSQILCSAAFSAVLPYLALYLRDAFDMADLSERGAWVAAFAFAGQFGFALFVPVWGKLADRYGRKLMLMRAYLISGILIPLMALMPLPILLVLLRFLVGAFSGTMNAAQTLICRTTPENRHGFAIGTLTSAWWSGTMMGYMAGGFIISRWGYAWGFLSCGLMLFAALLLVFFFAEDIPIETEFRPQEKERFRFRIPQFSGYVWGILFVLLLTGLARYFEQPYIALRVEEIGGIAEATKWTAIVSAVTALAGVLAGLGLGYLCDRLPPERIVVPAAIGSGILLMLQAATASMWVFGTARFCQYFMAGGIEPVFQTMLSRVTPPEKRGAVFGFAASFRSIGVLFSMAVGGVLIYYFGVRWIFFISGIFFFLLTPLLLRVIHRKSKKNV